MPRTAFPLTPEASTEIFGKDSDNIIPDETHFTLPPSAIPGRHLSVSSSASSKGSDSSFRPNSPSYKSTKNASITATRKTSTSFTAANASTSARDEFALPPPPTRKRKIIQMDPSADPSPQISPAPANKSDAAAGAKKKQSSSTSAGRKVARKTAHSLIERRRRSKMNEEFAVLKNMIPACAGQEMHKLAILQAGTEYLRYLEQCILDLKANNTNNSTPLSHNAASPSAAPNAETSLAEDDEEADSSDEDMADDDNDNDNDDDTYPCPADTSQAQYSPYPAPQLPSLASTRPNSTYSSPVVLARNSSYSPHNPFPYTPPASGILGYPTSKYDSAMVPSNLPSPAHEEEATAALLMLNALDRRSSMAGDAKAGLGGKRGMSVRDLLTN